MVHPYLMYGVPQSATSVIHKTIDGKATGLTDLFTNDSELTFYIHSINYCFDSSDGTPNYDGVFSVGKNNPNYDSEESSQSMGAGFQAWNTGSSPTGKVLPTETLKINVTTADTSIDTFAFVIIVTGYYL